MIVTVPFALIHIHPQLFTARARDGVWHDFLLKLKPSEVERVLPQHMNVSVLELEEGRPVRTLAVGGACPEPGPQLRAQAWAMLHARLPRLGERRAVVKAARQILTIAVNAGYAVEGQFDREDRKAVRFANAVGFD